MTPREKWAKENPEKLKLARLSWKSKNPEKQKEYQKKYYNKNSSYYYNKTVEYRIGKQQAIPGWANSFFIEEIYTLARLRTKLTGIQWEVDHIIPLNGKKVCGLHVENNLRIVTKSENNRKYNKEIFV